MADFKLHAMLYSAPSRTATLFMKLNNIPFDYIDTDLSKGEHKTPEFLSINRYGKVPGLSHGEFGMGESLAIIQYVAESAGLANDWWPGDIQQRAKVIAYLHWQHTGYAAKTEGYLFRTMYSPYFYGKSFTDEEINAAKVECEAALQKLNGFVAGGKGVVGTDYLTVGDVVTFCYTQQLVCMLQFDLTPYPEVQAWFNRFMEIDVVREMNEEFIQMIQSISADK